MKVLVTGGCGFIGSHIVRRLVKDGHEVSILDNLSLGSKGNLGEYSSKVKFLSGKSSEIKNINEKFEVIFHEGIPSSAPMYKENPYLVASALEDFIAVMEYAKKNGSKVVFASSSSLYNGVKPPHKEDATILVTDFYTEARLEMERLAELYHKLFGVQVIALRYFSVYGPQEESKGKYANLISQFLWAAKKGKNPEVYGDGNQKRDFIHVSDVVEANMLAMKSKVDFGIFNVGTGKSATINEMIKILAKAIGRPLKPAYVSNPIKNYVGQTLADTSKSEKILGFKAKVSLEEGIASLAQP